MGRLLAPLAAAALLVYPATAAAQNLCLPEANGVPYTGNAPPDWTTTPPADPENDPGWVGAAQTGHGLAADHAVVRAIKDGTDLYFSFQSRIALDSNTRGEVWIGFNDGASTRVFNLNITHSAVPIATGQAIACLDETAPGAGCTDNENNSYRILTGSPPAMDPGATEAATWGSQFGRVWQRSDGFIVNLRIPAASLGLSSATGPFTFWYQFSLRDVGGSNLFPLASWPPTASSADFNGALSALLSPPVGEWGTLELGTGGASCRQGVLVERASVGIAHGSAAGSKTSQIVGVNAGSPVANFFVATPSHSAGGAIPAGLEARFRIADWGSHPPTAPGAWESVHTKFGGASEWVSISGSDFVQGPWTLTASQRCEYGIAQGADDCTGITPRSHHQCILVELRATGGGVDIIRDSVYKNTNFVNLSTFERVASIGAQGLAAPPGATAVPMYLYVRTPNMPAQYKDPINPKAEVVARLRALHAEIAQRYSPRPEVSRPLEERAAAGDRRAEALLKRLRDQAQAAMPPETKALFEKLEAALAGNDPAAVVPELPTGVVDAVMPAMMVYVAHGTATKVGRFDEEKLTLLEPQGAFGYYAQHDGSISGWAAVIDGARRIGDTNWYVVDVPPGGAVEVNTRIQAREKSEPVIKPDPGWPRDAGVQPDGGGKVTGTGGGCCKCNISTAADAASHGIVAVLALILGLLACRRRGQRGYSPGRGIQGSFDLRDRTSPRAGAGGA